jgi:NADH-quinone oxidoreductase subunit M
MYQRTMTGPGLPERATRSVVPDLDRRELAAVVPLVAALVLFGFWPMPLLDAANPTVHTLLQHVGVQDDAPQVPTADHAEEGAH